MVNIAQFEGETEVSDRGAVHFLNDREREAFIMHEFQREDADYYEGDLAGAIHGVGIRGKIFPYWFLRQNVIQWMFTLLERIGAGGLTVYFYDPNNPTSLEEVKRAAESQHLNNTILFPRPTAAANGGAGIQRIEPSNSGTSLLQILLSYYDNVLRRYILGQNLTSEAVATGLGSGVAELHQGTFSRVVKLDAQLLADSLTTDFIGVLQKYSPWSHLPPLRWQYEIDKPNASDLLDAARAFYEMGGSLDEEDVRTFLGLAKPEQGHSILSKAGPMNPAGLEGMPEGVPSIGPAGPDPSVLAQSGQPLVFEKGRRNRAFTKAELCGQYAKLARIARSYFRDRGIEKDI
jgi:hypothetical protein